MMTACRTLKFRTLGESGRLLLSLSKTKNGPETLNNADWKAMKSNPLALFMGA
jgi:hypothetical protein